MDDQNKSLGSCYITHCSTGKFHKFTDGNYKVFPITQQIYDMQTKLRWICGCNAALDRHHWKSTKKLCDFVTVLAQLHLDYATERWSLTLNLDQQLKWHLQSFSDEQERISKAIGRWDHPVNIQLRWMKGALNYLDAIKIHGTDFDCDIDGGRDDPAATTHQEIFTGPGTSLSTDYDSSKYRMPPPLSQ